jgi:lysophospholipase L1-like esterase
VKLKKICKLIFLLITTTFLSSLILAFSFYWADSKYEIYVAIFEDWLVPSEATNVALGSSTIKNFNFATEQECGRWQNYGIGNIQIDEYIEFSDYFPQKITAKNVIIYAGENDIANGVSVKNAFYSYNKLLLSLLKKYPNANFHFIGLKLSPARNESWDSFLMFNVMLEGLSLKSDRYWYHSSSGISTTDFLTDGVHLNASGYKKIFAGVLNKC